MITEPSMGEEVQEMEVNLMQTMQERGDCQQKLSQICAKIFLSSNVAHIQSVPTDPLKEY